MKLMLGCGTKNPAGWTGVDIDPDVNPDIVDDASVLSKIADGSCSAVKSQHMMEHMRYKVGRRALENWYRVLRPGGTVSIECPDITLAVALLTSENPEARFYGYNGVFGDFQPKKPWLAHHHGYTEESLTRELLSVGFVDVRRAKLERLNDCAKCGYKRDMRLVARKPDE